MERLWWQLPGPSRFVEHVVKDLRDGKNVALCLPAFAPEGLLRAIRDPLEESGWPWETIALDDEDSAAPVPLLYQRFGVGSARGAIRNVQTLVASDEMADRIVCLETSVRAQWRIWREFLSDYARTCQARAFGDHTRFCAVLIGPFAHDPPPEDVRLVCHKWYGTANQLDLLIYASHLLQGSALSGLKAQVAAAIIASLAGWDPEVCHILAAEDLKTILDPVSILARMARERGWEQLADGATSCWSSGVIDAADGHERLHSAFVALRGDRAEIRRRIWSGQVGILLPHVERQRQQLLIRYAGALQIPYRTRFGVVNDLHDLEIGHIRSQMVCGAVSVPITVRNHVEHLYQTRNQLAHLECVDATLLDRFEAPLESESV